mgnify:CR=1 FL=1
MHHISHAQVGDPHQLPPVGPGSVLQDCVKSGAFPQVHLDEIFRQAEQSNIVLGAHEIIHGACAVMQPCIREGCKQSSLAHSTWMRFSGMWSRATSCWAPMRSSTVCVLSCSRPNAHAFVRFESRADISVKHAAGAAHHSTII